MKTRFLNSVWMTALLIISVSMLSGARAFAEQLGYVDVAVLFDEYEKTKQNDAELKKVGETKEQDREKIVKEIRALKDELVLLTDSAKMEKQDALDGKIRELQDFDTAAKRDLGERRNKLVREIFKDIDEAVQRFGERKGLDMILNERALLYHNNKYDVTQEVLKELNGTYKKQ